MARSLSERFDRQVDRAGDHHIWQGALNADRGTGRLKVGGKNMTAHRVAWELTHGEVPATARVMPCPEEPACVRVDHLELIGGGQSDRPGRRTPKGSGSKREVRPGTWELSVTVGRDADGQLIRVYRTVHGSMTEASRALTAVVAEIGDGRRIPSRASRGLTVSALIAAYLDHLRDHKGRKHSTLVRYTINACTSAGGCSLNRDIPAIINAGGLTIEQLDTYYAKGNPKTHGWTFEGTATTPTPAPS
jgi:hypothetical protein